VDMPQEIYTKFVSIRNTLKEQEPKAAQEGMLLMDISSGGLGITFVQDEKIKYQANFHVGIIRIKESFNSRNQRSSNHFNRALIQFLSSTIGPVRRALAKQQVRYLVLSGTETEMISRMLGRTCHRRCRTGHGPGV
jgi:exopolyphosphatase/guanosine-5'-triphosphate,3'-diphosphate pyrophosphatase